MILHFSHMGLTDARTFTLRDPPLNLEENALASPGDGSRAYHPRKISSRYPVSQAACVVAWRTARSASSSCHGVRIRGPSAVIAIVNSKWAASDPSCE